MSMIYECTGGHRSKAEEAQKISFATPLTCFQLVQAARGEMEVEEVQRDLGAMTTEEQRAAVMRDAPELAALLADLQSNLAEVRSRVGPLLTEVRAC